MSTINNELVGKVLVVVVVVVVDVVVADGFLNTSMRLQVSM